MLAGRVGLYRERVDFPAHHRCEQLVDHPMTRLQRLSGEARRHDSQPVVAAAAFRAFMPGVLRGFVFDLDRFRREGAKPVAYLVGYCQPRATV